MGSVKTNPFAPFQITYVYDVADKWGAEPWNVTAKNCSETYDVSAREISASGLFILKFNM